MRSFLFVPADSPRKLEKSANLDADALIFDLEDALSADRKAIGRRTLRDHFFASSPKSQAKRFIRVNADDDPDHGADLDLVVALKPDGVVLPKARDVGAIAALAAALAERGARPCPSIIALVGETPASALALGGFAEGGAAPELIGLAWGPEDLAAALGARGNRRRDGRFTDPHRLTRSLTLLAAHAAGVMAIDTVHPDFRDRDGLAAAAEAAAFDGFHGKLAIHPDQTPIINAAFIPTPQQCDEAQAVLDAFARDPQAGVVAVDGRMYDRPHLRKSRAILESARQDAPRAPPDGATTIPDAPSPQRNDPASSPIDGAS